MFLQKKNETIRKEIRTATGEINSLVDMRCKAFVSIFSDTCCSWAVVLEYKCIKLHEYLWSLFFVSQMCVPWAQILVLAFNNLTNHVPEKHTEKPGGALRLLPPTLLYLLPFTTLSSCCWCSNAFPPLSFFSSPLLSDCFSHKNIVLLLHWSSLLCIKIKPCVFATTYLLSLFKWPPTAISLSALAPSSQAAL